MNTFRRLFQKNKKRGQTIVFIVLVFQVLFVFVAMMINVGLLVHDKINLQNSVDLGAIYAAQRQAEILNAMAHINYQIRQSYKLLAWRYFILGNLGANQRGAQGTHATYSIQGEDPAISHCPRIGHPLCVYAVCMKHPHWSSTPGTSDHLCQNLDFSGQNTSAQVQQTLSPVNRNTIVDILAGIFSSVSSKIGQQAEETLLKQALASVREECQNLGRLNWYMASYFLEAFRVDQFRRKELIIDLFEKVFTKDLDIEGRSIVDGVRKTIQKNLTFSNYKHFDSFALRYEPLIASRKFEDYFEWEEIYPALLYVFSEGENTSQVTLCNSELKPTFDLTGVPQQRRPKLYVSSVEAYNPNLSNLKTNPNEYDKYLFLQLSSGFFKKTDNNFYFRVHVELENYKHQIFFPFSEGSVTLKATAWAKPFGALFGPPKNADNNLPTQPIDSSNYSIQELLENNRPNHSLYPGDGMGLSRHNVQASWVRRLTQPPNSPASDGRTLTNYSLLTPVVDPLVLNRSQDGVIQAINSPIRRFEEIAVAPDLFDLTYYTILSDYMITLYPKMLHNGALKGSLPGDLGYLDRRVLDEIEETSNLERWGDLSRDPSQYGLSDHFNFRLNFVDAQITRAISEEIPYKVLNKNHFLTSWPSDLRKTGQCDFSSEEVGIKLKDGFDDNNPFADYKNDPYHTIPQGCYVGGRSGFSVKLVDCQEVGDTSDLCSIP